MESKIHQLLTSWPAGAVRDVTAIVASGYSLPLLAQYRKSKWLTSLGTGALMRTGDSVDLLGGVYALQHDLKLDVHVGERSALELQRRAHYVRQGRNNFYLVGSALKLPKWFITFNWKTSVFYRSSKLFKPGFSIGLLPYQTQGFSILVSSPARAMLEYLDVVPKKYSFQEAKLLMEGLVDLRSKDIQLLLEGSSSIKVNRLFLLLAEECNHQWMKTINLSRIKLGIGKRNLVKGGVLHKKYQITVPAEILSSRSNA
jgi:hypothetical protein